MVLASLSIGAAVGVLLSAAFLYFEVGRFATPQVPVTLFDERKELFAYTAGLFVGVPLAIAFTLFQISMGAGALLSALVCLALLVAGGEVAQWALLRTKFWGREAARPFYALGYRAAIGGIISLAIVCGVPREPDDHGRRHRPRGPRVGRDRRARGGRRLPLAAAVHLRRPDRRQLGRRGALQRGRVLPARYRCGGWGDDRVRRRARRPSRRGARLPTAPAPARERPGTDRPAPSPRLRRLRSPTAGRAAQADGPWAGLRAGTISLARRGFPPAAPREAS